MRKMIRVALLMFLLAVMIGCDASLPEPESSAAQLYQNRCSGCHRLYAPRVLTAKMWVFQVDRMEQEIQRRGLPPLSPDEKQTILDYLQAHSSNGASPAASDQLSAVSQKKSGS